MARKKISEYRAKQLLTEAVEIPYKSITVHPHHPFSEKFLDRDSTYVVKVDEGVKKRMKQGLVLLDQKATQIPQAISSLQKKGYSHFIIEPFVKHASDEEKYFSMSLGRDGITVLYSLKGGIDVEDNQDSIKKVIVTTASDLHVVAKALFLDENFLDELFVLFAKYHFTLLEINPLVVTKNEVYFLDVAAEVDSAGEFFIDGAWSSADFRESDRRVKTPEEDMIEQLSQKSQASFKLDVLNQDGSVFMLLSGGGASIVLADEVYNVGKGKLLANYGEYSGNPNTEEVYLYTKNLLSLLLKSKAKKKVLIIAGGVANFTDVRLTFAGIIKALDESKAALQKQNVKVYVRRGGPHQSEGLANMHTFLEKERLLGNVSGPEMPLQEITTLALKNL
jgi:succinyl-CoA synthetase beta subunit